MFRWSSACLLYRTAKKPRSGYRQVRSSDRTLGPERFDAIITAVVLQGAHGTGVLRAAKEMDPQCLADEALRCFMFEQQV